MSPTSQSQFSIVMFTYGTISLARERTWEGATNTGVVLNPCLWHNFPGLLGRGLQILYIVVLNPRLV